jgi:ATP-binding cassette subfamily F protein uup
MPLLQLKSVRHAYGAAPLLDELDLTLEPGERVCLVGRNGAGKTTLMRILSGEEKPDAGDVVRQPNRIVTRLTQEIPETLTGSVWDVIHSGLSTTLHEEEWETDQRLAELADEMKLPVGDAFASLSGGLKRRVLLARALAGRPDVLLLDEPTNHLDLDSILWLESFLSEHPVTLFFVTHDRAFLRRLATRIVELDRGRLSSWQCGYDEFLERRAAAWEAEEKQRALFDKKLAQEEAWLRQGVKARRTRNEGRVRALKKLREERSQRREKQGTARMEIQSAGLSGQKVIDAQHVSFSYPGRPPVLTDLTTTIWRGDKIGIVGPNGAGKSTLLKILLGELAPTSGTVTQGTRLEVVYLDQLRGAIDDTRTVGWNVAGAAETVTFQGRPRHIHSYLQDFLFPSDRIRMPAKFLSGGERNRLLLARLFLQPANVLVLDEPTNDLDTETLELLEDLLVEYDGTLLLVSHDRDFLDEVTTNLLVFEGEGRIVEYPGGSLDWRLRKPAPAAAPSTPPPTPKPAPVPAAAKKKTAPKMLNRERRELEDLPGKIATLEARQQELNRQLNDADLHRRDPLAYPRLSAELTALETEISTLFDRWETLEALRVEIDGSSND